MRRDNWKSGAGRLGISVMRTKTTSKSKQKHRHRRAYAVSAGETATRRRHDRLDSADDYGHIVQLQPITSRENSIEGVAAAMGDG